MMVEFGHFCLILGLCMALGLAVLPMVGSYVGSTKLMRTANNLAIGQFILLLASFVALAAAFVQDDFSVAYVAANSNSLLPLPFKISATWGAHEGSFLLWCLIMASWTCAVALFSHRLPLVFSSRALAVLGLLSVGFLCFILFTSNPFLRVLPLSPADGADLNPLLQDFGLIVHPPLLYIGYVGFAVPFAFSIAALLGGQLDGTWARVTRPWANIAWAFLTIGVALGSWWAYYELGWGGWWFWDAAENASFMPWLAGTALIHSLAVTEKRGLFKSWTLLLAIAAFSMSLVGAFIVRSGVLTSVHAFAVDPERGLYILCFLVLVVGGSLLLFAIRAPQIRSRASFQFSSREMLLLVNNLLFVVAMTSVLLGTIYPLLYEALSDGAKISIGPPYFNTIFIPLMVVVALLLGVHTVSRWKKTPLSLYFRGLWLAAVLSVVFGVVLPLILSDRANWQVIVGACLSLWIFVTHAKDLIWRLRSKASVPAAYFGMWLAHIGFAVTLAGVVFTSHLSVEKDLRLSPGDSTLVAGRQWTFVGLEKIQGANYTASQGHFITINEGETLHLYPEKRRYLARGMVMTEAAIEGGLFGDLFIALGEPLEDGAWAVRVHHKPFVRWVWLGAILMGFGGIWALFDRRYQRLRVRNKANLESAVAT